jgi:hypothetical protein
VAICHGSELGEHLNKRLASAKNAGAQWGIPSTAIISTVERQFQICNLLFFLEEYNRLYSR